MTRKIIDRKIYDTDTATELASTSNHFNYSDFRHFEECLYMTPKGNFFLFGSGGPMSKYAKPCGDVTGGSCDVIVPLDKYEALDWMEQHANHLIESHFPDKIEAA